MSADGDRFEVSEAVANMSVTIKDMIEGTYLELWLHLSDLLRS